MFLERFPFLEPPQQRARAIWRGIVQFANTTNWSDSDAVQNLLELLMRCSFSAAMDRMSYDYDDEYADLSSESGVPTLFCALLRCFHDLKTYPIEETLKKVLPAAAAQHQPNLIKLLIWLSAPNEYPELKTEAIRFLNEHVDSARERIEEDDMDFDKSSFPFFYARIAKYRSIVDPVCDFISRGLDRYHESNRIEADLKKAVPFKLCERPDCRKIFLPDRCSKRFCSDKCRTKRSPRSRSQEENRDYQRRHRKVIKAIAAGKKRG